MKIVRNLAFVTLATLLTFASGMCRGATIRAFNVPYSELKLFYVAPGEYYDNITPDNIQSNPPLKFDKRQYARLSKLLSGTHTEGTYSWFYTRMCFRARIGTLLLIDRTGCYLDTYTGAMGKLRPQLLRDLEALIQELIVHRPRPSRIPQKRLHNPFHRSNGISRVSDKYWPLSRFA
jgi:hypothetical protein